MQQPQASPSRTLVAVAPHGPDARTHVLYFSDGTVVGYQPEHGHVLWEQRIALDLSLRARADAGLPTRPTPDSGVPAAIAAPERRAPLPSVVPPGGGRRLVDAAPQPTEPG